MQKLKKRGQIEDGEQSDGDAQRNEASANGVQR